MTQESIMRRTLSPILILLTFGLTASWVTAAGETEQLEAMGPWKADGTAYQIGPDSMLFIGAFSGVMLLEQKGKVFDAAEFSCPSSQEIDYAAQRVKASGHCIIETSNANKVFARWQCQGEVGDCRGTMEFTAGTGPLEGIKGGGEMRLQSFFADISEDEDGEVVVDKAVGVVTWPKLQFELSGE